MKVTLLDWPRDPLGILYVAYRSCYSAKTPGELWLEIQGGAISRPELVAYVERQLGHAHASPKQQVYFTFGVTGISRVLSHQLVRHHVGITFDQQSQRYVGDNQETTPIVPKSIASDPAAAAVYAQAIHAATVAYAALRQHNIPEEDARYLWPSGLPTNLVMTCNLEELLHIGDQRLCTRAQHEFRVLWSQVRAQVGLAVPELKKFIQPKCGIFRQGFCDEPYQHYLACPLGKIRPHKVNLVGRDSAELPLADGV